MNFKSGGVKIGAWGKTLKIESRSKTLSFKENFTKGKAYMSAWFTNDENVDWGAYYIKITRLSKNFILLE